MSPPLSLSLSPLAWILQASHVLPDNAKAPGGENSQGWTLSVQSGISAWGTTEKVLDHQLDRDAALLLLRLYFGPWATHRHAGWHGPNKKHWAQLSHMDFVMHGPTMDSAFNTFFYFSRFHLFQCNILNILFQRLWFVKYFWWMQCCTLESGLHSRVNCTFFWLHCRFLCTELGVCMYVFSSFFPFWILWDNLLVIHHVYCYHVSFPL